MNTLYILYDHTCPHSDRHREWLARQEPLVPLRLLAHRAEEVPCRFPGIEAHLTPRELTVISDDGQLWTGPAASVMCLFMLEQHREFAERLACPLLLPFARTALELLSRDREVLAMQCLFRRSTDAELASILRMNSEVAAQRPHLPPVPVLLTART
ncbi:MAG: hypothetical protein RL514_636 [Verrucomicrobiota bacterium]|jgi:predicted DCC family thiol-disulfide oxidoreductase YuxK